MRVNIRQIGHPSGEEPACGKRMVAVNLNIAFKRRRMDGVMRSFFSRAPGLNLRIHPTPLRRTPFYEDQQKTLHRTKGRRDRNNLGEIASLFHPQLRCIFGFLIIFQPIFISRPER
jgi:hypothetical protein